MLKKPINEGLADNSLDGLKTNKVQLLYFTEWIHKIRSNLDSFRVSIQCFYYLRDSLIHDFISRTSESNA